jgi:CelD/BcsL family acetyltransferase involved in cellulose biosynthesis
VETLSFEQFCGCEQGWDDLALSVESPVPFTSHAWLRVWWKHFGAGQEFVCIVLREGETLLAAAPIAVRRGGLGLTVGEIVGTGPVPTRGMGLADKADFLVRKDRVPAGRLLLSELLRLLERVDLLDIKGFDGASPTAAELSASAPRPASVRRFERSRSPCLALSGSWDDYLRSRSGNFRKHLRKYWRLLEQSGTIEVERMPPGADAAALMADVFAVNAASWKAERGTNLFREPRVRAFFAELVPELAAREAIDLHTVRLDGRLAVYELCFDFGGRLFSYNGAYRADLGRGSPGTALTASVIESAFARGRTEYDMCRGVESYKLRWSETQRSEEQLLVPADRLSARTRSWWGPYLKARLKKSPWLVEQADRLSGLIRNGVRSSI